MKVNNERYNSRLTAHEQMLVKKSKSPRLRSNSGINCADAWDKMVDHNFHKLSSPFCHLLVGISGIALFRQGGAWSVEELTRREASWRGEHHVASLVDSTLSASSKVWSRTLPLLVRTTYVCESNECSTSDVDP